MAIIKFSAEKCFGTHIRTQKLKDLFEFPAPHQVLFFTLGNIEKIKKTSFEQEFLVLVFRAMEKNLIKNL